MLPQPNPPPPSSLSAQPLNQPLYPQRQRNPPQPFSLRTTAMARHCRCPANHVEKFLYPAKRRKRELCNTHCTDSYLHQNRQLRRWLTIIFQNNTRPNNQLGAPVFPLAHDLWPSLLRDRDDAPQHPTLRPRSSWHHLPRFPSSI